MARLIPSAAMSNVRTRFAPSPDRLPAHRRRAHGALQLGLHAPRRRPLRAAHRGHRPRALDARVRGGRCSTASAGSASTGTRGRSARASGARATTPRSSGLLAKDRAYRCVCTPDRDRGAPPGDDRRRPQVDLRRPLPRAGPRPGLPAATPCGCGSRPRASSRWRRPGVRRERPGRARDRRHDHPPQRRRAALPPRRRGRRRRHGHHPRDPRRRPPQQHALPARAVSGARRDAAALRARPADRRARAARSSRSDAIRCRCSTSARRATCPRRCSTGWCASAGRTAIRRSSRATRSASSSTSHEVHRSAAQADPGKLAWLNQHYIKDAARAELLVRELLPFLAAAVGQPVERERRSSTRLVDLLRERSKTLVEMAQLARFFVDRDAHRLRARRRPRNIWKRRARPMLSDLHARAARARATGAIAAIERAFEAVRARHGSRLGKLAQPVRVAVTGSPSRRASSRRWRCSASRARSGASPKPFTSCATVEERRAVRYKHGPSPCSPVV